MNLPEIKALIDAMAASDLSEMTLARDGTTLRLVRRPAGTRDAMTPAVASPVPSAARAPVQRAAATPEPAVTQAITAPLYGVVHWRPAPDAADFVAPGQSIKAGQVVCVIEAMKVFNEVRAERDATVLALLAEPGQEVDAGQPLLRLG
jgi:acetyl-CoA carboxylase biotin carboxyl carrier protein